MIHDFYCALSVQVCAAGDNDKDKKNEIERENKINLDVMLTSVVVAV